MSTCKAQIPAIDGKQGGYCPIVEAPGGSPEQVRLQELFEKAEKCKVSPSKELADTWGEFLEPYNWDWFATFTFKDCTHPESAGKVHDNFIHKLNRDCYGQQYWKDKSKSVFYARGTEWQRRGVIHYHELIGGIPDFIRMSKYVNWWKAHVAPQVVIERYDASKGGRFYMAKSAYTFKRGEIDMNEAMVLESNRSRTCAKSLHDDFLRAYVNDGLLRGGLSSYRW